MADTTLDLSGHIDNVSVSESSSTQRLLFIPTEIPDVKEWIRQSMQTVRPWMEFINTANFRGTTSISRTFNRIKRNIEYFYGNYLLVSFGITLYCLITSPLIFLALLASFYINRYINRCYQNKKFVICGTEISESHRYLVIGVLCMPIFYLVGGHDVLFWALGSSLFVMLLHAAIYNIDAVNPRGDLFGEEV